MPTPTPPVVGEVRRPSAAVRTAPSLLSGDVVVRGSMISNGEVQVDGKIEGDIRAVALTIGDSGSIKGEVVAETVIVRGEVVGSIRAKKVTLAASAKVDGDIIHSSLAIEANAKFQGQVKFVEDALADRPKPEA
jgi:cytoskeletal protein CcmA (bactofilin family)